MSRLVSCLLFYLLFNLLPILLLPPLPMATISALWSLTVNENNAQLVTEEKGISDVVAALKAHRTKPEDREKERERREGDGAGEGEEEGAGEGAEEGE